MSARTLGSWWQAIRKRARTPQQAPKSVRSFRLSLEALEDRCGPCDLFSASGTQAVNAAWFAPPTQLAQASAQTAEFVTPLTVVTFEPQASAGPDSEAPTHEVRRTLTSRGENQLPPVEQARHLYPDALHGFDEWLTLLDESSLSCFRTSDGFRQPLAAPLSAADEPTFIEGQLFCEVTASARDEQKSHPCQYVAGNGQAQPLAVVSATHLWAGQIIGQPGNALDRAQGLGGAAGLLPPADASLAKQADEPAATAEGTGAEAPGDIPEPPGEIADPDPASGADEDDDALDAQAIMPPGQLPAAIFAEPTSLSRSSSGALGTSQFSIVSLPPTQQAPVVTPGVVRSTAENSTSGSVFRISRTPDAAGPALEVHYTLSAYSAAGVVSQAGAALLPQNATHTELTPAVPTANAADQPEVVVLQLRDHRSYRLAKPSATLFPTARAGISETALFEAFRQGQSNEAFSALVEQHREGVYQTCFRLLGNRHDAEDVLQLVFLALAQKQVRLQTTLAGWLRTVARNTAISWLRAKRRRTRHEQRVARPDLLFATDAEELREELDTALGQVSAPLGEAVRLRYLDGWSQHEAAQIVGCPRGTLAQRAAKGISCLRDLLAVRGHLLG